MHKSISLVFFLLVQFDPNPVREKHTDRKVSSKMFIVADCRKLYRMCSDRSVSSKPQFIYLNSVTNAESVKLYSLKQNNSIIMA